MKPNDSSYPREQILSNEEGDPIVVEIHSGLTKREWLVGMIASNINYDIDMDSSLSVEAAIELADEVIKQLQEEDNDS